MTSVKEMMTRGSSQHRNASTTSPMNVPTNTRTMSTRNHAHSVSLGTNNTQHRVSRRKSVNASSALTPVAAAVQSMNETFLEALVSPQNRDLSLKSAEALTRTTESTSVKSESKPLPSGEESSTQESDLVAASAPVTSTKSRQRRPSDAANNRPKGESRRLGHGELRCEKCGKGYKHSSCLTKHLWEHTPEWSYTSKLLISKHQQVQLLEAATVLVAMNKSPTDADLPEDALVVQTGVGKGLTLQDNSDNSSNSPVASSSSELADEELMSSAETTPPPSGEEASFPAEVRDPGHKRYSTTSSLYSRSFQSATAASSVPTSAFGSFHLSAASGRRPSVTASSGLAGTLTSPGYGSGALPLEDEAGLAAAVELCHFGTPRSGPVASTGEDIPPVPPLPARYASHNATMSVGSMSSSAAKTPAFPPDLWPAALTHRISDERDTKMHDQPVERPDEFDDGVFGHMEE